MKSKKKQWKLHLTSVQIIPLVFFALIMAGTLLLMLPFATVSGKETSFLNALFTAATCVCVTGSVVVTTAVHWTLFGKIVILFLIQMGGIGIISVCALITLAARRKFSLSNILLLRDVYNLDSVSGIGRFLMRVIRGTLIVELVGMIGYLPVFIPQFGVVRGTWYSFFTSVSAFCNAGVDIIGPDSLIPYAFHPLVLITTILMIIMGGLGYVVWFDLIANLRNAWKQDNRKKHLFHFLNEHTHLVLRMTLILIVAGAVLVFAIEYDNPKTIGNMPLGAKILNSIFQSVTFRTAGFATIPQEHLKEATTLVGDVWMFIGGSPVGTAGGIKTVTIFILIANVWTFLRGRKETIVLRRSISEGLIRKATAIVSVHFVMVLFFCTGLMLFSGVGFTDAMYETISAISTVGLSRALTPLLNDIGKCIIILAMFMGRIGPISMLLLFNPHGTKKNQLHCARGRFIVG